MNSTEICNMALSYIDKGSITGLDEETEEARQCKIHYDHCRRVLLGMYSWGFAKRQAQLAQLTETRPGWDYCYACPSDYLNILYVFDEDNAARKEEDRRDFDIIALNGNHRAVLTNVEDAWCEYTADIRDTEMFSADFISAMAHLLASSISMALCGNANIQTTQYQMAQAALQQAKWQDAIQKDRKTRYPREYANARFR